MTMVYKLKVANLLDKISGWLVLILVFLLPIKMSTPYTYNIQQTVPLNITEVFLMPWPAEWALVFLIVISLFLIISNVIKGSLCHSSLKSSILLVFIMTNFLSLLISGIQRGGAQSVLLFSGYAAIFYIIRYMKTMKGFKEILLSVSLISFTYCLFMGIYQHTEGFAMTLEMAKSMGLEQINNPLVKGRILGGKIFSTFIYSNSFAAYIIFWIPVIFHLISKKRYLKKLYLSFFTGFVFFVFYLLSINQMNNIIRYSFYLLVFPFTIIKALFLTRSQGSVIALILSIFIFTFIKFKKRRLILISGLIILLLIAFFSPLKQQLKRIYPSLKVRIEYNNASLKMISDKPFTGHGPGSYGLKYMYYKLPEAEEVQLAHNCPLQVAAETGIVSFILIMLFLLMILKGTYFMPGVFTGALALIIHSFIDFNFYVPSLGYLIFIVAGLSTENEEVNGYQKPIISKIIYFIIILILIFTALILSRINLSQKFSEIAFRYKNDQRDFVKAAEYYEKSVTLYPWQQTAKFNAAESLAFAGEFNKALKILKNLLEIVPENGIAWYHLAKITAAKDISEHRTIINKKDIITAYENALRFYPTNKKIIDEKAKFLDWINKNKTE